MPFGEADIRTQRCAGSSRRCAPRARCPPGLARLGRAQNPVAYVGQRLRSKRSRERQRCRPGVPRKDRPCVLQYLDLLLQLPNAATLVGDYPVEIHPEVYSGSDLPMSILEWLLASKAAMETSASPIRRPGPLPAPVARWRDSLAGRAACRWRPRCTGATAAGRGDRGVTRPASGTRRTRRRPGARLEAHPARVPRARIVGVACGLAVR